MNVYRLVPETAMEERLHDFSTGYRRKYLIDSIVAEDPVGDFVVVRVVALAREDIEWALRFQPCDAKGRKVST